MRTILAAAALMLATPALQPAAAAIEYPWCAYYGDTHGGINCGFVSWQQCQAAITGNGGVCTPNGFYNAATTPAPRRERRPGR